MPRVSISILAYNNFTLTKRCVESVFAAGGDFELLLTDNACGDGTGEFFDQLAASFNNVRVFHNETNEGFIPPNVRALAEATGEFIVFLNNDATVPRGWLEKLIAPFDADPLMAITGPEGGCCRLNAQCQGGPAKPGEDPEYVEFACAMCRVDLMRKHGLFDPAMTFAYYEDVETSIRMRELGYKLKLVPFRIAHHRGATAKIVPNIRRYQYLNGQVFRRRHGVYLRTRRFDFVTVVRRAAAWGDVLLTTPIIRALKQRNPQSEIWVETKCCAIFRHNPHVAVTSPLVSPPKGAQVFDLNGTSENRISTHLLTAYAEAVGIDNYDCRLDFPVAPEDRARANELLNGLTDGVAVHIGPTTWRGKNWPMDRWRVLLAKIEAPIVLVGHGNDEQFPVAFDLRGRTTVHELGAVLERCRLLITVDSFPLHVAQAVGTPIIPLFGVTSPEYILTDGSRAGPVCADHKIPSTGLRHRVSGQTMVQDAYGCMNSISVDAVMNAYNEMSK